MAEVRVGVGGRGRVGLGLGLGSGSEDGWARTEVLDDRLEQWIEHAQSCVACGASARAK